MSSARAVTDKDRETLALWPEDEDQLQKLEDALAAAGVQPPSTRLPEWETVRERPTWRAFLARRLGI